MSKKQEYNYVQLLNFIEDAEYVNPWIGECILRFIREKTVLTIDVEYKK